MQPLLTNYIDSRPRVVQQPAPLTLEGYPGNEFSLVLHFEDMVPYDLTATVRLRAGGAAVTALTPSITAENATDALLVFSGSQMSLLLDKPHYLTLSWGGQVQVAGDVVARPHTQTIQNPTSIDLREMSGVTLLTGASQDMRMIVGETPTGTINGVNAVFTALNDFIPETVELFINGLRAQKPDDFNTLGVRTLITTYSPAVGESITVNYHKL